MSLITQNTTSWNFMERILKMDLGLTPFPLNIERSGSKDTKKLSGFSHLLLIRCLGVSQHSLSAFFPVFLPSIFF